MLPHEFVTHKWHVANKWAGQQRQDVKQKMLDAFNKFKEVRFFARFDNAASMPNAKSTSVDSQSRYDVALFRTSNTINPPKAALGLSKMRSGRFVEVQQTVTACHLLVALQQQ